MNKKLEFDFMIRKNINIPYIHERKLYSRVTVDNAAFMYLIKIVFNYKGGYDGREQIVPFVMFDNI